ncbi:MAG: type VI secretion system accessory protein TagJ [Phycisphaerae bacterium]
MTAEELIRGGNLEEALAGVQAEVRKKPADAKLRVLLFQLLAILGQWDRALTQLNVSAELDPLNLLMAQVCRVALQCEALRADIFSGGTTPMVLGQPPEWLGQLIQANDFAAKGRFAESAVLREQAFDAAPAISGKINDEPFAWLADADPRLGPVMEAMVDGKYYWIPLTNIREIQIEAPTDLRDLVWISANFTWLNGGTKFGLIPVRYPGSEKSTDSAIRMARKTDWTTADTLSLGLGQRELVTEQKEYAFLEVRSIVLDQPEVAVTNASASEQGSHNG